MYIYTIITHGVVYSVVCLVSLALARLARQGGQSVACMLRTPPDKYLVSEHRLGITYVKSGVLAMMVYTENL